MRQKILYFFSIILLFGQASNFACGLEGKKAGDGFLPENDMYISAHAKRSGGMSKETFNKVLDKIQDIYGPILSTDGKDLNIQRNWENGTVNAYATQSGNTWTIAMFGGLARHHSVTPDGFALVACHELGHHLGGLPKKISWWIFRSWASNEGQADYFASLKCLRKYMESDDNVALMEKISIPALVAKKCEENFSEIEEVAICKRGAMAGMSLAGVFADLRDLSKALKFDSPDPRVVRRTYDSHPEAQCRLDTYFAGSICDKSHEEDIDQNDINWAQCARVDGYTLEARPLCWYKPKRR